VQPTFYVWAKWDDEAKVWYTAEASIRGLLTEAETMEGLRERLKLIIPDFLEDQMPARAVLHIIAECDDELRPVIAKSGKGGRSKRAHPEAVPRILVDRKIRSRHLANRILKEAGIGKKF
jgi:hypothetical protein